MKTITQTLLLLLLGGLLLLGAGCLMDDPASPAEIFTDNNISGLKIVTISSPKKVVIADGITATLITATCTVGGEPAPDSMPVEFRVTYGCFSDNGLDKNSAPLEHQVFRKTKGGIATAYLISYYRPTDSTVTAIFANTVWDTVDLRFK